MLLSLCAETINFKPFFEGDKVWQLWKEMHKFIKSVSCKSYLYNRWGEGGVFNSVGAWVWTNRYAHTCTPVYFILCASIMLCVSQLNCSECHSLRSRQRGAARPGYYWAQSEPARLWWTYCTYLVLTRYWYLRLRASCSVMPVCAFSALNWCFHPFNIHPAQDLLNWLIVPVPMPPPRETSSLCAPQIQNTKMTDIANTRGNGGLRRLVLIGQSEPARLWWDMFCVPCFSTYHGYLRVSVLAKVWCQCLVSYCIILLVYCATSAGITSKKTMYEKK